MVIDIECMHPYLMNQTLNISFSVVLKFYYSGHCVHSSVHSHIVFYFNVLTYQITFLMKKKVYKCCHPNLLLAHHNVDLIEIKFGIFCFLAL